MLVPATDLPTATPQTSTKHLTDEELKQQYGIHLTSRIQADGDGKEAKWADIDDDEDDWAPETIEWNDGTKSTLTPAELAPPPPPTTQKPATPSEIAEKPKPPAPPKVLTPHFASSVGPNAIVLKLGQSAERQQAQKTTILQAKGSSEKPSLVSSKPAAPTPAKSPWAPLPPVEKVSPVAINPQMAMAPQNRIPPGHSHGQGPSPMVAPSPAKEISADDFNRSWRETQPGQPRELYMPNSGRYEAVPEGRRRMSRNDQNFRAPAVLQRPSHADSHGPAEPSAAFQTHRTSTDQARRRASSTLSGGSGQFGRRMSIKSGEAAPPVFESHDHHRDHEAAVRPPSTDGPAPPIQPPAYQARGTSDSAAGGPISTEDPDFEAQRAQQRALMKEKIELARRRKIEEEQRLEAEKQERIRLKLASLGLEPNVAKNTQGLEDKKEGEQTAAASAPSASASTTGVTSTTTHSPPKPPQPLASGEPQQYGMMKVHPLDSVKKLGAPMPRPAEPQRVPVRGRLDSGPSEASQADTPQVPSPIANGARTAPELRRTSGQEAVGAAEPSPKLPKPSSVAGDARSGWGDVRHEHRPQQAANLWGLPNNKSLGNGTFDQGLAGYAPQDLSRTSSTAQGWMNNRTPHAGRSPQPEHVNHLSDARSFPYQPITSPDPGPLAADSEVDSLLPTTKPAPIAPPQSQQAHAADSGYQNNARPHGVDAWANFHQVASHRERAEDERRQREMMARREEELSTGIRQGPQYTFNETWKQVQVGDSAEQRQVANVSQSAVAPSHVFGAVGSLPGGDMGHRMMAGPPGRGSRFFPHHTGGHHATDRRAFTYSHPGPTRSPSPPPAEDYSSLHPAFDGNSGRPVVHFPREKAVVKLPPVLPPTPPSPTRSPAVPDTDTPLTWAARVSMPPPASSTAALRAVSTPLEQNALWQEKFNGLFGRKSSPAREVAQPIDAVLAVASSTREPLEQHHALKSTASVSLPAHTEVAVPAEDGSFATTKDVESEDDLFEDREPGSLPAIHLPQETPKLLPWTPAFSAKPPLPVEPFSCHPYMVINPSGRHGPLKPQYALIRFPGSNGSIRKDIPFKGQPANNPSGRQRFNSGGGPHSSGSYAGKNPRSRNGPRSRHASKAH